MPSDPNRMIVIVTGANTGVGLGICHRLVSALSLPLDQPISESIPQQSAFSASPSNLPTPSPQTPRSEIALTLILACRSLSKAQIAKEEILEKHLRLLEKRRGKGLHAPPGWREGLRIEIELLDVDSPNGENGILDFCQRLESRYPHITSLFSNAGVHPAIKTDWLAMILEVFKKGPFRAWSNDKAYMEEEVGRLSRDKKRGAIWGINTFATYLLATELLPLLQNSPPSLPFSPRVIYTTSSTAELSDFTNSDPTDVELRSMKKVYASSKYAGDLLISDLDQRYGVTTKGGKRGVRAFGAEPGCVATNAAKETLIHSPIFGLIQFANWLVFFLLRLAGSPFHPRDTEDSTAALLYAALAPDTCFPPIQEQKRFKFGICSHPLSDATVQYTELDGGDTDLAGSILKAQLKECERVRAECRHEAGLE